MYKSFFRICLFVIISMLPWAGYAAGLGKLTLNSALGQPFRAEIDLVSIGNSEVSSLKANLASRDAFQKAGINYEPFFSTFAVSIESRSSGALYAKIVSPQSVNEPFLNMLVELSWSSGRLLREYTILLDPVETDIPEPVVPTVKLISAANESELDERTVLPGQQADDSNFSLRQPVVTSQVTDTYGPVARGDTLSRIAREVSPQGVNLNQMLVALYRANHDAFIKNNMNLLKVGAILRIPSSGEIAMIKETDANMEVKAQVTDWYGYRDKLATVSGGAQARDILKQTDTGQISTTVGNESVAMMESPKEILKLSSGTQSINASENTTDGTTLDRLRMMEEDSIARNLALKEANERVAMLEKSIENLQLLLELEDPVLAKAQLQAETTPEIKSLPASDLIEVVTPSSDSTSDLSPNSSDKQKSVVTSQSTADSLAQNHSPTTDGASLINQLNERIEYVGVILVLSLLGILIIVRRKRSESEASHKEIEDFDEESLARHNMVAAATTTDSLSSFDTDDPRIDKKYVVPPGFDDVSSSRVNEAERDLSDQDVDSFSSKNVHDAVNDSADSEKAISLQDQPGSWERSASESDVELNLDRATNGAEAVKDKETNQAKIDVAVDQFGSEIDSVKEMAEDAEMNLDLDGAGPSDRSGTEGLSTYEEDYDFSTDSMDTERLDDPFKRLESESELNNMEDSIVFELDTPTTEVSDTELLDEATSQNKNTEASEKAVPSPGESSIAADSMLPSSESDLSDLNMDDPSAPPISDDESIVEKTAQWHEVATKIDLAKAYQEMDDKEGAKEILEEVMHEGDAQQQEIARRILEDL
ncbi:FimV/HubP family polar landmark protein [Nitrosomonas cryotolerans]|uniref:FimV/HubP family polar landmark protein n=1 Tax=Nitrosomonas cryotolerans TaxID=44575 RepID=UPI00210B4C65|nr:FimV/HubP family polar landmark protein [Nitrosomonas cryotolerans]